jgi:DUF1365 family protein
MRQRAPDTATPEGSLNSGASRSSGASGISGEKNALYVGAVRHARYQPKTHRFGYRVFSAYLNVDDLDANRFGLKLLSVNRWNLFSVRSRDHGARDGSKLRPFLNALLDEAKISPPDEIYILCYPRMFGFAFNPLTVYYCFEGDQISAMIYEVRNTFGDDHTYVVPLKGPSVGPLKGQSKDTLTLHCRDKRLHVSPFMEMQARYHFSTAAPNDRLRMVIRETQDDKPLLVASFQGEKQPLTDAALLRAFLTHPLMTVKVVVAIHYEAAKIFLKGVPFIKRPKPPETRHSHS